MDPNQQQLFLTGGASKSTYLDEVFSTYTYRGTADEVGNTGQTITNGIDLAGDGGLVWMKVRSTSGRYALVDTVRGAGRMLATNENSVQTAADLTGLASFNSNGFSLGNESGGYQRCNMQNQNYASWSFKKQKGFFDVVTFTTGTNTNRRIPHSLGQAPGMILMKNLDQAEDWILYHSSLGRNKYSRFNTGVAFTTSADFWGSSDPTGSDFGFNEPAWTSANQNFVAYLWANNSGGNGSFGEEGDQDVIKCGMTQLTENSYTQASVDLGWMPQLVMFKKVDSTSDYRVMDHKRGFNYEGMANALEWDSDAQENLKSGGSYIKHDGFRLKGIGGGSSPGQQIIWMAIRIPDATVINPESIDTASEIFDIEASNTSATAPCWPAPFRSDGALIKWASATSPNATYNNWRAGMRPAMYWVNRPNTNDYRVQESDATFDTNTGYGKGWGSVYYAWMWKNSKGYFSTTWHGSGANRQIVHGMGQAPEMIWVKNVMTTDNWHCYHKGLNGGTNPEQWWISLNQSNNYNQEANVWNNTAPTATHFTVGTNSGVNSVGGGDGNVYTAFCFSSVTGISKVGYYTGQTTDRQESLGFAPRFILIKRIDIDSDWLVFDTTRGMAAGTAGWGEVLLTKTGAGTFTVPDGVTSLKAVCVGAGGGANTFPQQGNRTGGSGGGGGGLSWHNNLPVTPGQVLNYSIGEGGAGGCGAGSNNPNVLHANEGFNGGDTYFQNALYVQGCGGQGAQSFGGGEGGNGYNTTGGRGTAAGDGGGQGGNGGNNNNNHSWWGAGGGAGGYSGSGGRGCVWQAGSWNNPGDGGGSGGGSGGGQGWSSHRGVGMYGEGSSGSINQVGSGGFSGFRRGGPAAPFGSGASTPGTNTSDAMRGGQGAIRVLWGAGRSFPSTNVQADGIDSALVLNEDWTENNSNYIKSTDSTSFTIQGNHILNVANGKYIYYAHA